MQWVTKIQIKSLSNRIQVFFGFREVQDYGVLLISGNATLTKPALNIYGKYSKPAEATRTCSNGFEYPYSGFVYPNQERRHTRMPMHEIRWQTSFPSRQSSTGSSRGQFASHRHERSLALRVEIKSNLIQTQSQLGSISIWK